MSSLLSVENMTHYFGGLRAVSNYNLNIQPGHITGLIGPNGAGKTTIFNLITGVHTPTEGTISLEDKNIVGLETHRIASLGLGRTFQNLLLWRHMNVLDHIKMAHYSQLEYGLFGAFFGTPSCKKLVPFSVRRPVKNRRRKSRKIHTVCLSFLTLQNMPTRLSALFPTEPSGAWKWQGPWQPNPKFSFWMNLLPE